ncbi:MAG: response regulator [Lachnospiraceae bacterium]|nr:response regulator [Lachnospiraceae bacterium]
MLLKIVFLCLTALLGISIIFSVKQKRLNKGYVFTAVILLVMNILCFLLNGTKAVKDAKYLLTAYYVLHAWIYFGELLVVNALGRHKRYIGYSVAVIVLCMWQTLIFVGNLFGTGAMIFARHIFWGENWWIVESSKHASMWLGIRTYQGWTVLNMLILFVVMLVRFFHSSKIFKGRLNVLGFMHISLIAVEIVTSIRPMPVWIMTIYINILTLTTAYFIFVYPDRRLREWSLLGFANDMNDAFVLYDEFDELIHVNDVVKKIFPGDAVELMKEKKNIDEWLQKTMVIEGIKVNTVTRADTEFFFKSKKIEFTEKESKLGTAYILHDTSESIRLIRAMREANLELARAAKMKSDFLANMSHEIRTPMNAVIGMAEIAMREDPKPEVMDCLIQIQSSGRALLSIINDILDFSKIEAGKMEIVEERYEPLSELNDIANMLMTRVDEKKLNLMMFIDNKLPHALIGDVMRIRQILINLANNAIKFTKEGLVKIDVTCEIISEEDMNLTFHVIDTGQGIKKEDLEKLFTSFSQVDSKRNRYVEGTGLGLAISKSLVEAMGGSIGVESTYGRGSDFYFTIPQKIEDPTPELVVEDAEHKHAFVIDDKPMRAGVFVSEMEKLGLDGYVIPSIDDFKPLPGTNFVFFEMFRYDENLKNWFKSHPDVHGVVLVGFDKKFDPGFANVTVMRMPETTLNMVLTLNEETPHMSWTESDKAYKIDYTAPEAKILIVDDNAINITIAEGLLRPMKVKCYSALSGKAAIELLEKEKMDIILMDHMMPEMDGIECTRIIRESVENAKDTPIIALTANVMEGVRDMFISAGMNDFVAKPVNVKTLATCLRQWIPEEKILEGNIVQEETVEEVIEYDGLDSKNAIEALGSADLYKTIVKEYYKSADERIKAIKADYDNEDWKGYTIKVHALKSASRQVGAFELGDMAMELEDAGNHGDIEKIKSETETMLGVLIGLTDGLSKYFKEDEAEKKDLPIMPDEMLESIKKTLLTACDDLDMDVLEEKRDELKKFNYDDATKEKIKRICDAIDDFDTEACLEILEEL